MNGTIGGLVYERRGIKPPVDRGIGDLAATDAVGKHCVTAEAANRPGKSQVAAVDTSITHDRRKGNPRTRLDDAGNSPPTDDLIQETLQGIHATLTEGKIVANRPVEIMGGVIVRYPIICARVIGPLPEIHAT